MTSPNNSDQDVTYPMMDQDQFDRLYADGLVIENADLSHINWMEADYPGLKFRHCRLVGARLIETMLEDGHFEDCQFLNCGFSRSILTLAVFDRCSFFASDSGKGSDFSYANLRDATFTRCNLSNSSFKGANLYELNLEDCKAQGVDFAKATFSHAIGGRDDKLITQAHLHRCNFDYANFRDMSFEGCSLIDSSFREADLSGCDFLDADMSGADLSHAFIQKAGFENTDLRGATLEGFDLSGVGNFQNMKVSETQQSILLHSLGVRVFP